MLTAEPVIHRDPLETTRDVYALLAAEVETANRVGYTESPLPRRRRTRSVCPPGCHGAERSARDARAALSAALDLGDEAAIAPARRAVADALEVLALQVAIDRLTAQRGSRVTQTDIETAGREAAEATPRLAVAHAQLAGAPCDI